ncbi:hypothetical protein FA15DRAFT_670076, partial [Coprinopsis marcescibilis]
MTYSPKIASLARLERELKQQVALASQGVGQSVLCPSLSLCLSLSLLFSLPYPTLFLTSPHSLHLQNQFESTKLPSNTNSNPLPHPANL